jgi:hypothetical protein
MLLGYYMSVPITAVTATVYPAYRSYKAIASKDAEEATRWLQYWVVFALFSYMEFVFDFVSTYMPFYYEGKLSFLLWLSLDKFQGATKLFEKFILPTLDAHSGLIDEQMASVTSRVQNFKVEDVRALMEWATDKANSLQSAASGAAPKAVASSPKKAPKAKEAKDEIPDEKPEEPEEIDVSDATHETCAAEEKKDK